VYQKRGKKRKRQKTAVFPIRLAGVRDAGQSVLQEPVPTATA
jgi:hypothetical protein